MAFIAKNKQSSMPLTNSIYSNNSETTNFLESGFKILLWAYLIIALASLFMVYTGIIKPDHAIISLVVITFIMLILRNKIDDHNDK